MSTEPNSQSPASANEAVSTSYGSLHEPVAASENLPLGIAAGVAAMLVGTAIWVGVTVGTGYQIGYLAVGVGFLVGISMRWAGRGHSQPFAVTGAALALIGCALGNLLTGCYVLAGEIGVPFGEVVADLNFDGAKEIMSAMFSPMDILFYALALWAGFKYSVVRD